MILSWRPTVKNLMVGYNLIMVLLRTIIRFLQHFSAEVHNAFLCACYRLPCPECDWE